jgi:hypothetical protein
VDRVEALRLAYEGFISVPWSGAAAAQRVIFCVYEAEDERKVRFRLDEFRQATERAGHGWAFHDLADRFADWLPAQRYARRYFERPEHLRTLLPRFQEHVLNGFEAFLGSGAAGPDDVVAVAGAGSLYGLLKVRDVVDGMAPLVPGRLLVFFPGSCEGGNYRLLDAYDGWNYHAVPVTAAGRV